MPVSDTDWLAAGAATRTVNDADIVPALVGANETVITHELPGAKAAGNGPQLLICLNCFAFVPPSKIPLIVSGAMVPVFITVTVCGALVVPRLWVPKLSEAGDKVKTGRMIVPVRDTTFEVAGAATFTFSDADLVRVLVLVGLNVT